MSDKFLGSGGGSINLSNGSATIFSATLGCASLDPSRPIKTNSVKQLISANLDIADVNTLATQLTEKDELTFAEDDTHTTPATGKVKIYAKTDSNLYKLNDQGVETAIGGGGGGSTSLQDAYVNSGTNPLDAKIDIDNTRFGIVIRNTTGAQANTQLQVVDNLSANKWSVNGAGNTNQDGGIICKANTDTVGSGLLVSSGLVRTSGSDVAIQGTVDQKAIDITQGDVFINNGQLIMDKVAGESKILLQTGNQPGDHARIYIDRSSIGNDSVVAHSEGGGAIIWKAGMLGGTSEDYVIKNNVSGNDMITFDKLSAGGQTNSIGNWTFNQPSTFPATYYQKLLIDFGTLYNLIRSEGDGATPGALGRLDIDASEINVVSHIISNQTSFTTDQQLVTKKYVDDQGGGGGVTQNYVDRISPILKTDLTATQNWVANDQTYIGHSSNQGNIHLGYNSGGAMVFGSSNTSLGQGSMSNAKDAVGIGGVSSNVAIGHNSLVGTSGSNIFGNVCVGATSGFSMVSGVRNTAIGTGTLNTLTTGGHNTVLGDSANVNSVSANYRIALGQGAISDVDNHCVIGGGNATSAITAIKPGLTNNTDLGSTSKRLKNIYIDGQQVGFYYDFGFACSDEISTITTTGEKIRVPVPRNMGIRNVFLGLNSPNSSGSFTVSVKYITTGSTSFIVNTYDMGTTAKHNITPAINPFLMTQYDYVSVEVNGIGAGDAVGLKIVINAKTYVT